LNAQQIDQLSNKFTQRRTFSPLFKYNYHMGERLGEQQAEILLACELIRATNRGVVLTGAGISTPSGIPDFRSAGSGLWSRYNPMEVASLSAFRYKPENFFDWMRPLARQMAHAQPNPAHIALAHLEQAGFIRAVITQNIDGLHQRAGSREVFEVHGTFQTLTCIGCYRQYPAGGYIEPYIDKGLIPRCPKCEQVLKPDVILFEEQLPYRTWTLAQQACHQCDLIIVAGSSLEVTPVANLPYEAVQNDAKLIIINQTPTYLDSRANVLLRGNVAEVIPRITRGVIHG
jgi:NAD-dependent deacetylase